MYVFSRNSGTVEVSIETKRQYLKNNGWYAHYNDDCWFDNVGDKLYVEGGNIVGFRDKNAGLTLEEAFNKINK